MAKPGRLAIDGVAAEYKIHHLNHAISGHDVYRIELLIDGTNDWIKVGGPLGEFDTEEDARNAAKVHLSHLQRG